MVTVGVRMSDKEGDMLNEMRGRMSKSGFFMELFDRAVVAGGLSPRSVDEEEYIGSKNVEERDDEKFLEESRVELKVPVYADLRKFCDDVRKYDGDWDDDMVEKMESKAAALAVKEGVEVSLDKKAFYDGEGKLICDWK